MAHFGRTPEISEARSCRREVTAAGEFLNEGVRTVVSPTPGEDLDWVLVLDPASEGNGPPGT